MLINHRKWVNEQLKLVGKPKECTPQYIKSTALVKGQKTHLSLAVVCAKFPWVSSWLDHLSGGSSVLVDALLLHQTPGESPC